MSARHFPIDRLLQNGWVFDSPALSSAQRNELDTRSRDPNSYLLKERAKRNGISTTLWRVVGAAHPKES